MRDCLADHVTGMLRTRASQVNEENSRNRPAVPTIRGAWTEEAGDHGRSHG
jgi:hypothetical protein